MKIRITETDQFIIDHALDNLIELLKSDPKARRALDEHIQRCTHYQLPDCHVRFVENTKEKLAKMIEEYCKEEKKEDSGDNFIEELAKL